mgnify:CR=1 FL=1
MGKFEWSERVSDDFLCVNSCDCQRLFGISAGSNRPRGRIDYHMLYIAKGTCYVSINGEEIAVHADSVVIYLPNQPQKYRFKAEDDSVSYYVHFAGKDCENILNALKLLDRQIIPVEKSAGAEGVFKKLVREFHMKRPFYEQCCNGILISLLSAVARGACNVSGGLYLQTRLNDICIEMHQGYAENFGIKHYAEKLNISASRFTHVFTETMGISPKQYILRIKFDHAIELLANTDLSVSQIAELVGIPDSNYFSRIFKKHTGHAPGFYR